MNKARVLVVEDERIIAMTLRQMLESRGYTVVGTAATAQSAIGQAKSATPDIVLMDIHLEGASDGIEAARQIEADSGTPIVFLTAYTEDETIRRASEVRAYSYLVKPVQAAELHATLQIALSKHTSDHRIRHSEHRLRLALDASSLAVWDWNPRDNRVETTGNIHQLLGHDANGPTLDSLFSGILPDDQPAFDNFLARVSADSAPSGIVFRYRWQDQDIRWLQAYASAYAASTVDTRHTIGTLRDITVQHETESRLRQAATLFENIADAIAITGPDLRITATNPAFTRLTNYTPADALSAHIEDILPPSQPAGAHWQGETICRRANGDPLSVWLTIAPVNNGGESVTAVVYSFSDITPLRRAQADLDFLAHHDALTALPNRLLFNERLDAMTAAPTPFALFYIDLDRFKLINDSRGHFTGDLVLQTIAGRIRALIADAGFAARLGGDEFVIVATPTPDPNQNARFAQRLIRAIAEPILIGGEALITTASVGISEFPANGASRDALVLAADTAMYAAKRDGPNTFRQYSLAIAKPHNERYEIEQEIRRAFESSQLQLLYQPIVSLNSGRLTGAEALVRWRHPERGLLNPDRFVPIAEDAGLIEQLGESVLRMACRDWAIWTSQAHPLPRLSINVSARQITRGTFPAMLAAILQEFALPASCIEIEITESSLQSVDRSQRFISELKELGVAVAIDDFGTGYSHLALLRDLPVDRIKLDRKFLPVGPPRPNDVALLNAIVGIARAMNLQLTAEGIETRAQFELVRRIGCDEAQGFWFSHPVAFADLSRLLIEPRP